MILFLLPVTVKNIYSLYLLKYPEHQKNRNETGRSDNWRFIGNR